MAVDTNALFDLLSGGVAECIARVLPHGIRAHTFNDLLLQGGWSDLVGGGEACRQSGDDGDDAGDVCGGGADGEDADGADGSRTDVGDGDGAVRAAVRGVL